MLVKRKITKTNVKVLKLLQSQICNGLVKHFPRTFTVPAL